MTFKSVINEETFGRLDRTHAALADWDGQALPDEPAFAAFAEDLKAAQAKRQVGEIAKRVNSEYSGAMSKFKGIARKVEAASSGPYKELFLSTDKVWGDVALWRDHQERLRALHVLLLAGGGRSEAGRRWDRARARRAGGVRRRLCAAPSGSPASSPCSDADPRLPGRLPAGDPAAGARQPADDLRHAAVLDLAAGAHHGLVRAAALAKGRSTTWRR